MVKEEGKKRTVMRKKLDTFPAEDGHIESILVGCNDVKLSFQTWNEKAIVIIFRECGKMISEHSVKGDVGRFECEKTTNELNTYSFYDASTDELILCISAQSMELYEVGVTEDINGALMDVGYGYLGSIKQ